MTAYVAYASAPLDFVCQVTFDAGAGATTLTGGAIRVDAINDKSKAKVAGTATILTGTTARCTFAAGSLPPGNYEVQVLATPIGATAQVVSASAWHVKPGAAP